MSTQITLDFVLIARCLGALVWGIGLACFLQYQRLGQFLAHERAWLSVIIGVGGDLLLGIGAAWWQLWLIVACSSLGVIARSLNNEQAAPEPALNKYKTKWAMEETIDACGSIITALEHALSAPDDAGRVRCISTALSAAHQASRHITFARYGEPEKSK